MTRLASCLVRWTLPGAQALFGIMLYGGLRVSEAISLRPSDIKDDVLVLPAKATKGNLRCPYAYGVVLPNVTRRMFDAEPVLAQVTDPHLVICKDGLMLHCALTLALAISFLPSCGRTSE